MNFKFKKAVPVWAKGMEREKNYCLSFRAVIDGRESTKLYLAASTCYRVFVNNKFAAHGPARTAKGFYRVDVIDITPFLQQKNIIVIEVAGYNVNSFSYINQTSFLCAEFVRSGVFSSVLCATGAGKWDCRHMGEKLQKVQRYSYQRCFAECYRMDESYELYRKTLSAPFEKVSVAPLYETKKFITRGAPYPKYETIRPSAFIENGSVKYDTETPEIKKDRALFGVVGNRAEIEEENSEQLLGFNEEELEEHLSEEFQKMRFIPAAEKFAHTKNVSVTDGYIDMEFPYDATGMFALRIKCRKPTAIWLAFSETLTDGEIDPYNRDCCNIIKYYLAVGEYNLINFEPYTCKYLKLIVSGECVVHDLHMVEYKHPPVTAKINIPRSHDKLALIYEAAVNTYRQNAVDIFMDCPSRERAGWLCDSFFTGRVEKALTGSNRIERDFIENFFLPDEFEDIPEGMLPMCYPSDHYNSVFIPNWPMWFVLEIEEYFKRSLDLITIKKAKARLYKLADYFKSFENEDGLLQNLKSWVFVEWSRAADFVQDVNYPTNMLYSAMLKSMGRLYRDKALVDKGERIAQAIREKSYMEPFFTDNAILKNDVLVNTGETTEVCQYYAFFFGIATPEQYPELWDIIVKKFGPERKERDDYPNVHIANSLPGNYLRLDLLIKYGCKEQAANEIEKYFYFMAKSTGTLWEHDNPGASVNHGFASHVVHWLKAIYNK